MAPSLPRNLHVLIMAGGSGTRFWPKSRARKPKQLLALWDEKTLLEHTVERFARVVPVENIWIVTTQALVEASKQVLGEKYRAVRFLGEPEAKNTAACILWGVSEIKRAASDAIVAVMPADHYIGDEKTFAEALAIACETAEGGAGIVTLGIRPNRPEIGYGYIETEKKLSPGKQKLEPIAVSQFVEKPDLRTALRYLETGKYVWNAGMFIFKADSALDAFRRTMPELFSLFEGPVDPAKVYGAIGKRDSVSIDYGVMEPALSKGISVSVIPVDCGWNDVGSFTALEEIDCATMGDVVAFEAPSNIVQTDAGVVALLGVNDLVVVRDGDVVMVCAKDRAQDIKVLLEKVKKAHPDKI